VDFTQTRKERRLGLSKGQLLSGRSTQYEIFPLHEDILAVNRRGENHLILPREISTNSAFNHRGLRDRLVEGFCPQLTEVPARHLSGNPTNQALGEIVPAISRFEQHTELDTEPTSGLRLRPAFHLVNPKAKGR